MPEAKVKNVRTGPAQDSAPADVADAPAAPKVSKSGSTMEVTDTRGRKIVVKKLNALEKMRLAKVMGPDGVTNPSYSAYATIAASVISIDGEHEPFPMTTRALEAMVTQLDDEGLEAATSGVYELNGISSDELDLARAKNS